MPTASTDIQPGQTWEHRAKALPNIQIAGRAVNVDDAWAVTTAGLSGARLVPAAEIRGEYVLVQDFKRPGTG